MSLIGGPLYYGGGLLYPGVSALLPRPGRTLFLDTVNGSDDYDGTSWGKAWATLENFLDQVESLDRLFFVGDVREEGLVGSNLAFDVQIVGCGGRHHPDSPGSEEHVGAAMIRPPASPTAATELLNLRGRGWEFHNVHFDCPVDAAAIRLHTNALSGDNEYDASHAGFYGCSFQQGLYAIEDVGGVINVEVIGCDFRLLTESGGCGIINTSAAVRLPQNWKILGSHFFGPSAAGANEAHIDSPFSGAVIRGNVFGQVAGSAIHIDLTGGGGNVVTSNLLMGTYDTSDYVPGTDDDWTGNYSPSSGRSEVAGGITIAAPTSP